MSSLFKKKKPKKPQGPPPMHAAEAFRTERKEMDEGRVLSAMDADLGIRKQNFQKRRTRE